MSNEKKQKLIISIIIFLSSYLIHMITANQTVSYTDNGELAATCYNLGVAHPSGYPLFVLLGYIYSFFIPSIGAILAFNLFSAFFVSITSVLFGFMSLHYICKAFPNFSENPLNTFLLTISSGLTLSYASTIWAQATSFEVYSLHLFFIVAFLYSLLKFDSSDNPKYLIISFFILSFSFANHLTTVLIIPPLVLYLIFNSSFIKSLKQPNFLLLYFVFPALITISFYIFMYLLSSINPYFNWGDISRGFDEFKYHVQGKQYQIWMFNGENTNENLVSFFSILPKNLSYILVVFVPVGIYLSFKYFSRLSVFLSLYMLINIIYSINYSIHDIDNYFLPSIIILINFGMLGIIFLLSKFKLSLYFLLILPLLNLSANYSDNDNSNSNFVEAYSKTILDNLDSNSIIISAQWDYWNSAFWYYSKVENYRSDVVLIEKELLRRTWMKTFIKKWYPDVYLNSELEMKRYFDLLYLFEYEKPFDANQLQQSYVELINSIIDKNFDKRSIYITLDVLTSEQAIANKYQKIPEGFAFRLALTDSINSDYQVPEIHSGFLKGIHKNQTHLEKGIFEAASLNYANIGRFLLFKKQYSKSKLAFEYSLQLNKENQIAQQGLDEIKLQSK